MRSFVCEANHRFAWVMKPEWWEAGNPSPAMGRGRKGLAGMEVDTHTKQGHEKWPEKRPEKWVLGIFRALIERVSKTDIPCTAVLPLIFIWILMVRATFLFLDTVVYVCVLVFIATMFKCWNGKRWAQWEVIWSLGHCPLEGLTQLFETPVTSWKRTVIKKTGHPHSPASFFHLSRTSSTMGPSQGACNRGEDVMPCSWASRTVN